MESDFEKRKLTIPVVIWVWLLVSLRLRGKGIRESGAFLLGVSTGEEDRVTCFELFDDLDPQCLETGIIRFRGNGFSKLWGICRTKKLNVFADIHTHPGVSTKQSCSDKTNPMICEPGHVAIIAPKFARTLGWRMRGFSIYEYLGNHQWSEWTRANRTKRAQITLW